LYFVVWRNAQWDEKSIKFFISISILSKRKKWYIKFIFGIFRHFFWGTFPLCFEAPEGAQTISLVILAPQKEEEKTNKRTRSSQKSHFSFQICFVFLTCHQ
jgi:hypothetical protein